MTKEEAKSFLPILEAFVNGETIQTYEAGNKWIDRPKRYDLPVFFKTECELRIKPKPREFQLVIWPSGHAYIKDPFTAYPAETKTIKVIEIEE